MPEKIFAIRRPIFYDFSADPDRPATQTRIGGLHMIVNAIHPRHRFTVLMACLCLSALSSSHGQEVTYLVELRDPATEAFHVTIEPPVLTDTAVSFFIPAWAPGNYFMNDYGRWIDSVTAVDSEGQKLPVVRRSLNEWRVSRAHELDRLTYVAHDIPEDSLESLPTTLNEIDRDYFFFNGPTVLGYLEGFRNRPARLTVSAPEGWTVWCSLDTLASGEYLADDYDQLIDCPVLAGTSRLKEYRFEHRGALYVLAVNSPTDVPMDSLLSFTRTIVDHQTTFFNEIPFRQYYFLFNFVVGNYKYGALEHANSSAYFLSPPFSQRFLRVSTYTNVIAHEFFHLWNPKLFYPEPLGPFDYQKSPRIRSMWFIEGLTEYYSRLTMVRSGLATPQHFYEFLRGLALENNRDDLEKLGLEAGRTGVAAPMYTKGALISFLLDVEIRDKTKNRRSLDDVVLEINRRYGHQGRGYDDRELIGIMEKISGVKLAKIHKRYIAGTREIPVDEYFKKAALLYTYEYPAFLGWVLDVNSDNRLYVQSVADQSTASGLGLAEGDLVLRIAGQEVGTDLDSIRLLLQDLQRLKTGDPISVHVERNGERRTLLGQVLASAMPNVQVLVDPEASPLAHAIRRGILFQEK